MSKTKAFTVGVCAAVFFALTGTAGATAESITPNQAVVLWGQTLSFTGTFTSAEKKQWPPRIYNPVVAISCSNGWRDAVIRSSKADNIGGGWWQASFGDAIPVGSGAGTCTAWMEFTSSDGITTVLASTTFPID